MATEFTDSLGRSWIVSLDFAAAKRIKASVKITNEASEEIPFDIIDAGAIGLTMQALRSRYLTVGETMYAICRPQADQKGVTEEQFLEGVVGDSLDDAADVIEDELVSFFPRSLREVAKVMFRKAKEVRAKALQQAAENLDQAIEDSLAESGVLVTKRPELSESILVAGASES